MSPTPFALLVILAGVLSSSDGMLRTLMLCCLFGAAAAIALPALGGAPITPAVMLLPFLMWRAARDRAPTTWLGHVAYPQAGFWLLLLVLWGVLSAYFLPRLFIGETMLYATDRASMTGVRLLSLRPLSTNFTQSAYAVAGLCTFVAVRALLEPDGRLLRFRDAVLLLASVDCAAALLNLAELRLGLPSLLALVRNAGYAILVGGDVGGLQRISGTFAEASAFAGFSLPLLAFSASLWRDGVRPVYTGALSLGLLVLLLISTSTTAYAGLCTYGGCITLAAFMRAVRRGDVPHIGTLTVLLWLLAVAACIILLARPDIASRLADFFGVTLVRKLESASGIERGSWNRQAWINFVDAYGVGVGLGSARASSYLLVLLSNIGVIGLLLFIAFVGRLLGAPLRAVAPDDAPVVKAARRSVLAALIAATVSAVVFDLGPAFYAFAAAASAVPLGRAAAQTSSIGARHEMA
ncbi:hypothetical protein [Piscinibacter sp.]|jgi:hypothetical protein|uniref:hypothetical protein n=1 Tax=Piscinibacter sp. TaxID=1903157 RepID=UPI002F3F58D7